MSWYSSSYSLFFFLFWKFNQYTQGYSFLWVSIADHNPPRCQRNKDLTSLPYKGSQETHLAAPNGICVAINLVVERGFIGPFLMLLRFTPGLVNSREILSSGADCEMGFGSQSSVRVCKSQSSLIHVINYHLQVSVTIRHHLYTYLSLHATEWLWV